MGLNKSDEHRNFKGEGVGLFRDGPAKPEKLAQAAQFSQPIHSYSAPRGSTAGGGEFAGEGS